MRFLQDSARLILALWLAIAPAYAGSLTLLGAGKVGAAAYQGPGDVVSGAVAFWSSNSCYTAAFTGAIVDIVDHASGNTTGTRLQCGAGGVVSEVVSASACTFVTGNACSPLATTCAAACDIRTLYNQSGTTSCTGTSCDITGSVGNRPPVNTSALSGKPCGTNNGNVSFQLQSANSLSLSQPYTFMGIGVRNGNFTSNGRLVGVVGGAVSFGFRSSTSTFGINAGTVITATASDSSPFHAFVGVGNGASSLLAVDGAVTGPTAGGTTAISAAVSMFNDSAASPLTGIACEGGIWPVAFSTGQISGMNANMHARWGF